MSSGRHRAEAFCRRFNLTIPILLAPMAGACPVPLSAAVANAGGMGALGALLSDPPEIVRWAQAFRSASYGGFMINLWVPDAPPARDDQSEAAMRAFLSGCGPKPPVTAGDGGRQDFDAQCEALLEVGPAVISSIMGLFPAVFVERMKARGIAWFATATTTAEARAAEAAGADVIVAQGAEAGGHRGAFDPSRAAEELVGTFALVPRIADLVNVPVVAAGGIGDGRGVAAALTLGASAVQVGTAFLRSDEAAIAAPWAELLRTVEPEATEITRAFTGRPARAVSNAFTRAVRAEGAPQPAPYPVQRGLTAMMRAQAIDSNDIGRVQAWSGQGAALASGGPAAEVARRLWEEAQFLLPT